MICNTCGKPIDRTDHVVFIDNEACCVAMIEEDDTQRYYTVFTSSSAEVSRYFSNPYDHERKDLVVPSPQRRDS